jgi:hypothetical protein
MPPVKKWTLRLVKNTNNPKKAKKVSRTNICGADYFSARAIAAWSFILPTSSWRVEFGGKSFALKRYKKIFCSQLKRAEINSPGLNRELKAAKDD